MADLESLANAPGTMREYETIYILRPETPNDKVADINGRVRGVIEKMGGKVLEVDNWGKRRLAYEVESNLKGIYLYWQYLGTPGAVAEFERNMRMLDSVIRYMTVKVDEDVVPDARPTEVDDETYERAATTAADEEDLMMRGSGESATEAASDDDDSDVEADGAEGDDDDEAERKNSDEAAADPSGDESKE